MSGGGGADCDAMFAAQRIPDRAPRMERWTGQLPNGLGPSPSSHLGWPPVVGEPPPPPSGALAMEPGLITPPYATDSSLELRSPDIIPPPVIGIFWTSSPFLSFSPLNFRVGFLRFVRFRAGHTAAILQRIRHGVGSGEAGGGREEASRDVERHDAQKFPSVARISPKGDFIIITGERGEPDGRSQQTRKCRLNFFFFFFF